MAFSPLALEHIANPRNSGPLQGATHKGVAGSPGGGPYVVLWMIVEGDTIKEASYDTYGCPAAVASASVTAAILKGRTIAQALALTARDLTLILGGLPPGKEDCPALAAEAVRRAFEGDATP